MGITRFLKSKFDIFSANVEVEDFTWSLFTLFGAENSIGMLGNAILRKTKILYSVPEKRKNVQSIQSNFHSEISLSNFQVFSEKYFVLTLLIPDFYQFTLAALVEVGSQGNWKHQSQTTELH
jgi:hypothetical protein